MGKISRLFLMFSFILFFIAPLFAEEALEEAITPEEEVTLVEEAGEGVITGEVTSLDTGSGTITVKTADGSENTFSVIDGETILWKGIEDIELKDINEGDQAEVGYYTDENGKLVASWVDVLIEEGIIPLAAEEAEAEKKGSPKGSH